MKRHRISISREELEGAVVSFSVENTHYLRNVLRSKLGQQVSVMLDRDEYIVKLSSSNKGKLQGNIEQITRKSSESAPKISLAFACIRPGPMEQILRHGTELGVSLFMPVITARSNRRPRELKQRWSLVAQSAAAQSQRTSTPVVAAPMEYGKFLESCSDIGSKLMLSLSSGALPLLTVLEDHRFFDGAILVGPEGGLDSSEELMARESGFIPVKLGAHVLRTETAALLAVGMIAAWWEWQDGTEDESRL